MTSRTVMTICYELPIVNSKDWLIIWNVCLDVYGNVGIVCWWRWSDYPGFHPPNQVNWLMPISAGASSQYYWDELMLLKCEIMLLERPNTTTNKNGFLLPTKCVEWVLKYSYLVSIISIFFIYVCEFLNSSLWL